MEDAGYIGSLNKKVIQAMVASYHKRKQVSTLNWVKGPRCSSNINDRAIQLAKEGVQKISEEQLDLEIEPTLQISGAILTGLTQSRAYKALCEQNQQNHPKCARTQKNIKLAKQGAKELFGYTPTEQALWKSARHKGIDHNTRYLIWMSLHDAYRIGSKWLSFGLQYHERAYCNHCNSKTEDMAHIMTECSSPGQKEVWELTRKLLEKREIPWHLLSMANILACMVPIIKAPNGNRDSGRECFYHIIMSLSMQVIWNARCERVIQNDNSPFSPVQI
ncbi:hypothetical protein IW262DRAFT_1276232 [Armillaria fumosa]|nr:hypothetical protein IW262DRAFT_1276232 [Armillaria fumosa]